MGGRSQKIIKFRLTDNGPELQAEVSCKKTVTPEFIKKFILQQYGNPSFATALGQKRTKLLKTREDDELQKNMALALVGISFKKDRTHVEASDNDEVFWNSNETTAKANKSDPPGERVSRVANKLLGLDVSTKSAETLSDSSDTRTESSGQTPRSDTTEYLRTHIELPALSAIETEVRNAAEISGANVNPTEATARALLEELCLKYPTQTAEVVQAVRDHYWANLSPAAKDFWRKWLNVSDHDLEQISIGNKAAAELLQKGLSPNAVWAAFLRDDEASRKPENLNEVLKSMPKVPGLAAKVSNIKEDVKAYLRVNDPCDLMIALAPLWFLRCSPNEWPDTAKLAELCKLTASLRGEPEIAQLYDWTLSLPQSEPRNEREKYLYIVKLLRQKTPITPAEQDKVRPWLKEFANKGSVGDLIEACGSLAGYRFGSGESLRAILADEQLRPYLDANREPNHLNKDKYWAFCLLAEDQDDLLQWDLCMQEASKARAELHTEAPDSLASTPADQPQPTEQEQFQSVLQKELPSIDTLFEELSSTNFNTCLVDTYNTLVKKPYDHKQLARLRATHMRLYSYSCTQEQATQIINAGWLQSESGWKHIQEQLGCERRDLESAFVIVLADMLSKPDGYSDDALNRLAVEWLLQGWSEAPYSRGTLAEICGSLAGLQVGSGEAIEKIQNYINRSPWVDARFKHSACWILPRDYPCDVAVKRQENIWITQYEVRTKRSASQIEELLESISFDTEREPHLKLIIPGAIMEQLGPTLYYLGENSYKNSPRLLEYFTPSNHAQTLIKEILNQYLSYLNKGYHTQLDPLIKQAEATKALAHQKDALWGLKNSISTAETNSNALVSNHQSLANLLKLVEEPSTSSNVFRCYLSPETRKAAKTCLLHIEHKNGCTEFKDWDEVWKSTGANLWTKYQQLLQIIRLVKGNDEIAEYHLLHLGNTGCIPWSAYSSVVPKESRGVQLYQLEAMWCLQNEREPRDKYVKEEYDDELLADPGIAAQTAYDKAAALLFARLGWPKDAADMLPRHDTTQIKDPLGAFLYLSQLTPALAPDEKELERLNKLASPYSDILEHNLTLDRLYVKDYPLKYNQSRKYRLENEKKDVLQDPDKLKEYFPSLRPTTLAPGSTTVCDRAENLYYFDLIAAGLYGAEATIASNLLAWHSKRESNLPYQTLAESLAKNALTQAEATFIDTLLLLELPEPQPLLDALVPSIANFDILKRPSTNATILRLKQFLWQYCESPCKDLLAHGIKPPSMDILCEALKKGIPEDADYSAIIECFFSFPESDNIDNFNVLLTACKLKEHPLQLLFQQPNCWPNELELANSFLEADDDSSRLILKCWRTRLTSLDKAEQQSLLASLKQGQLSALQLRTISLEMVRILAQNEQPSPASRELIRTWCEYIDANSCAITTIECCGALAGLRYGTLESVDRINTLGKNPQNDLPIVRQHINYKYIVAALDQPAQAPALPAQAPALPAQAPALLVWLHCLPREEAALRLYIMRLLKPELTFLYENQWDQLASKPLERLKLADRRINSQQNKPGFLWQSLFLLPNFSKHTKAAEAERTLLERLKQHNPIELAKTFFTLVGSENSDNFKYLLKACQIEEHPLQLLYQQPDRGPNELELARSCMAASKDANGVSLKILEHWSQNLPDWEQLGLANPHNLVKQEHLNDNELDHVNTVAVIIMSKLRQGEATKADKDFMQTWCNYTAKHNCVITAIESCGTLAGLPFGSLKALRLLTTHGIKLPSSSAKYVYQDAIWQALLNNDPVQALQDAVGAKSVLCEPELLLPATPEVLQACISTAIRDPYAYFADPIRCIHPLTDIWPSSPPKGVLEILQRAYESTTPENLRLACLELESILHEGLDSPIREELSLLLERLQGFLELVDSLPPNLQREQDFEKLVQLCKLQQELPIAKRVLVHLDLARQVRQAVFQATDYPIPLEHRYLIADGITDEAFYDVRRALLIGAIEALKGLPVSINKVGVLDISNIIKMMRGRIDSSALSQLRSMAQHSLILEAQYILDGIEHRLPADMPQGLQAVKKAWNQGDGVEPYQAWLLLNSLTPRDHQDFSTTDPYYHQRLQEKAAEFSEHNIDCLTTRAVTGLQEQPYQPIPVRGYLPPAELQNELVLTNKQATVAMQQHAPSELIKTLPQSQKLRRDSPLLKMAPACYAERLLQLRASMPGLPLGEVDGAEMNQQMLTWGICQLPKNFDQVLSLPTEATDIPWMRSLLEAENPQNHNIGGRCLRILLQYTEYRDQLLTKLQTDSNPSEIGKIINLDDANTTQRIVSADLNLAVALLYFAPDDCQLRHLQAWKWLKLNFDGITEPSLRTWLDNLELEEAAGRSSHNLAWHLESVYTFRQYAKAANLPIEEYAADKLLEGVPLDFSTLTQEEFHRYRPLLLELADPLKTLNQLANALTLKLPAPNLTLKQWQHALENHLLRATLAFQGQIFQAGQGHEKELAQEVIQLLRTAIEERAKASSTDEDTAIGSSSSTPPSTAASQSDPIQGAHEPQSVDEQLESILMYSLPECLSPLCFTDFVIKAWKQNIMEHSSVISGDLTEVTVTQRYTDLPFALEYKNNPLDPQHPTFTVTSECPRHREVWDLLNYYLNTALNPDAWNNDDPEQQRFRLQLTNLPYSPPSDSSSPELSDDDLPKQVIKQMQPLILKLQTPIPPDLNEGLLVPDFKKWFLEAAQLDPPIDDANLYPLLIRLVKDHIASGDPNVERIIEHCKEIFPNFPAKAELA